MKQTITLPNGIGSIDGLHTITVNLPAMPGDDSPILARDPRHETAPRRSVVTPREDATPYARFMAAIRELREEDAA